MRIVLITPYLPEAHNGNAHTALRWTRFLRAAGHKVTLTLEWDGAAADAMIALHARRSAPAIHRYAAAYPDRPLIVVLTGTDLYRDIRTDAEAQASLQLAHRLVVLQARGLDELAPALRAKAAVIYQSAPALKPRPKPKRQALTLSPLPPAGEGNAEALRADAFFDICVVAHLREEKDPFRAAYATAYLPPESRIRVLHVGEALSPEMAAEARRCGEAFPRWHWLGRLDHGATRQRIARSHLLVNTSRMEGGAHVILEAVTAGVSVLASRIPGNEGMLGLDYAGYFQLGDEAALGQLMRRTETDTAFRERLSAQCAARAPLFDPARERAAVQDLIIETSRQT